MHKLSNFKLGIGLPCSFPFVHFATVLSMLKMDRPNFELIPATNGPVDGLRNHIVETALKTGCTHIIMMDMDQTYPVNTIPKLLSHKLPVVGCLIHRRYPPFDPLIYKGKINEYERIDLDDYEKDALIEVDATGTGCLMFETRIFRSLPAPWFKFKVSEENGQPIGEDFGFCSDLRKKGYRIFVDTSIKCGHLSTMEITEGTYHLYRALKKAQSS